MTTVFYKAVILQGEIWHWSLLGLKGLIFFTIELSMIYFSLLLTIVKFKIKAIHAEGLREILKNVFMT